MTGNATKKVMALFDSLKIDWSEVESSPKESNSALLDQDAYEKLLEQRERKAALPSRLQVLRVLIRKKHSDKRLAMSEEDFCNRVESLLDRVLLKFGYDLEKAIDHYQALEVHSSYGVTCESCGFRPVFCQCRDRNWVGITCNDCHYFTPDKIGDGVGIGDCGMGLISTPAMTGGLMPLYSYARRICEKFSKLTEGEKR